VAGDDVALAEAVAASEVTRPEGQAKRAGLARKERGQQPKLTIKVPSAICRTGRD